MHPAPGSLTRGPVTYDGFRFLGISGPVEFSQFRVRPGLLMATSFPPHHNRSDTEKFVAVASAYLVGDRAGCDWKGKEGPERRRDKQRSLRSRVPTSWETK